MKVDKRYNIATSAILPIQYANKTLSGSLGLVDSVCGHCKLQSVNCRGKMQSNGKMQTADFLTESG